MIATALPSAVTARSLTSEEIPLILRTCWEADDDFLVTLHRKAPCSLDEALADTVRLLSEASDTECFVLEDEGKTVGLICLQQQRDYLTAFALAPSYRTFDGKLLFVAALDELTNGEQVLVALYERNVRAIRFLQEFFHATAEHRFIDPDLNLPVVLFSI